MGLVSVGYEQFRGFFEYHSNGFPPPCIAGCYSERIPVLHLVGVPHIGLQDKHALLQ